MKKILPIAFLFCTAVPAQVVAVDGWHNNEKQPHYRWEGTYQGGFSQLGTLLKGMDAELRTIGKPFSATSLKGVDCLIAVDPDTPAESDSPHYFTDPEIAAVEKWVSGGGVLVLLGNDKGNAEFEHFNKLAGRFGIRFVEGKYANPEGVSKLHLKTADGLVFYGVDLAPLELKSQSAEVLLADNRRPLMALVKHGKGSVLALGDPWLYNEYIGTADNGRIGEKLFRRLLRK